MPIYEYECKNCRHRFEQLQKISEKPIIACPECDKESLTKLVSNTSFQLKGTGWYVTDFKDKKPVGKKEGESSSKKKETKKTGKNNQKK